MGTRAVDVGMKSNRGGINEQVGRFRDPVLAFPNDERDRGRGPLTEMIDQGSAANRVAVDDGQVGRAGQGKLDRDRSRGPSGAEDDGAHPVNGADSLNRFEKTFPVGVVTDQRAIAVDHAIDRADGSAVGLSRSRCSITATLWGMVQLNPRQFIAQGASDGIPKLFGSSDGQISPIQPHVRERGFDHRLCRILGDRVAEDADEFLLEGASGRHVVPAFCRGRPDRGNSQKRIRSVFDSEEAPSRFHRA